MRVSWYALNVRSNHERRAAAGLRARYIEYFSPVYHKRSRWSDRIKQIDVPFFPGYVFARFMWAGGLLQVLDVPGVVSVCGGLQIPASIPDCQIDAVRRAVESKMPVEPALFAPGDRALVCAGPLAGLVGTVLRRRASANAPVGIVRLILSIEMLGRGVAVELDADVLQDASSRDL